MLRPARPPLNGGDCMGVGDPFPGTLRPARRLMRHVLGMVYTGCLATRHTEEGAYRSSVGGLTGTDCCMRMQSNPTGQGCLG